MSSDLLGLLAAVQYADSAYPAGGFAQSWGLETAVSEGAVLNAADVERATIALLRAQVGPVDGVAAAGCCRLLPGDLSRFAAIDRRVSAARPAREIRQASERMGKRLLETAAAVEGDGWLATLATAVEDRRTPGNHAAVAGALLGLLGASPEEAAALVLWMAANALLSASVRLLPIAHTDVQSVLVRFRPVIAEFATKAASSDPECLAGSAPQFEIWSMRHELAGVRLFAS